MKINIVTDEWYPVHVLVDENRYRDYQIDIPEDKIEWIKRVYKEFDEIQTYLETEMEKQR